MRNQVACIAFAIALAGCRQPTPSPNEKDAKASPAGPTKVSVASPTQKSLRKIVDQPGSILPYEETELFAKVGGYISKLHADIGKKVRGPRYDAKGEEQEPGEILAEIDVPELAQEQ